MEDEWLIYGQRVRYDLESEFWQSELRLSTLPADSAHVYVATCILDRRMRIGGDAEIFGGIHQIG